MLCLLSYRFRLVGSFGAGRFGCRWSGWCRRFCSGSGYRLRLGSSVDRSWEIHVVNGSGRADHYALSAQFALLEIYEIGRASCRERV